MSSALYWSGRMAVSRGLDVVSDPLSFVLVTPDYVFNNSSHLTQADIPTEFQISECPITGRVLDSDLHLMADDTAFYDIPPDTVIGGIVLIQNTGEVGTSPLLIYYSGSDFPITSDGTPFVVQANDALGILAF